jgi:hypothetical protein
VLDFCKDNFVNGVYVEVKISMSLASDHGARAQVSHCHQREPTHRASNQRSSSSRDASNLKG